MRRSCIALVLLLPLSQGTVVACTLSPTERQAYLYQAVQLLQPPSASQAQTGTFRVKADHYYDNAKSRYVPVKKISVHEYRSWATEQTEWNSGRIDQFELRLGGAEVGKYYQIKVDWEDGRSATSEYQMQAGGTTVTVSDPD